MKCEKCKFWEEADKFLGEPIGPCHRYPPITNPDKEVDSFPLTMASDWCGEFSNTAPSPPISHLGLSARAYNALLCCGYNGPIETVGQLQITTDSQLLKRRNLGKSTLREIRRKLMLYKEKEYDPRRTNRDNE